jgi:purine-nucleoside phosphorylase
LSEATLYDRAKETADWLTQRAREKPVVALILGSGLGDLADTLGDRVAIPYGDIPHFPVSGVEGHAGNMVFGEFSDRYVCIMQGRVHYYEGWSADEVTFPVRVLGLMGIERILITNSAGGINPDFQPGDLMLITDHINLTGYNPLRGENDERFGPRFPDMSDAYDTEMRETIIRAAREINIPLKSGVYAGMEGPSYETPAEIRMIHTIGGDAVGMSTVPETIVANHMGLKVGGISCISNLAAGISQRKLSHAEVKATANLVRETFSALVHKTVELI